MMPALPRRGAIVCLCVAAFAAVAGSAAAQAPGQIARIDTNRDGIVSLQEFRRAREADFRLLDRNRDGRISRTEFVLRGRGDVLARRRRAARFEQMDRNRDGQVSAAEYRAFGDELFSRLDRDRNRQLTAEELRLPVAVGSASPAPSGRTGGAPPPPDSTGPARRVDAAQAAFARIDRNGDGVITGDELDAARRAAFKRLDTSRDGRLTAAEILIVRGRGSEKRFLQMDTNRDGTVTLAEFLAAGRALLKRADRNGDGRLTLAEFRRAAAR